MQYIVKRAAKPRKAPVKAHKPKFSSEKRVFPKNGESMSTALYIVAYYEANAAVFGCTSGHDVYNSLFSPYARA